MPQFVPKGTTIVLVDDNDQPLSFTEQTPEQRTYWDRQATLYHAYQMGLEAGKGDPWCAAVMEARHAFDGDGEARAEYNRGFQETTQQPK